MGQSNHNQPVSTRTKKMTRFNLNLFCPLSQPKLRLSISPYSFLHWKAGALQMTKGSSWLLLGLKCTINKTNLIKTASLKCGYCRTRFSCDQVAWMQSQCIQCISSSLSSCPIRIAKTVVNTLKQWLQPLWRNSTNLQQINNFIQSFTCISCH